MDLSLEGGLNHCFGKNRLLKNRLPKKLLTDMVRTHMQNRPLTAEALMRTAPVIPVLTIDRIEDAVPLAQALVKGGLPVLEVTLRTPSALEAIKAIAQSVPDALIGAGTIRTPEHARQACDHGARFLVSPGTTPALISCFAHLDCPVLPGCSTISEAMELAEAGFQCLKFFPAEAAGGIPYLKSLSGASAPPVALICKKHRAGWLCRMCCVSAGRGSPLRMRSKTKTGP